MIADIFEVPAGTRIARNGTLPSRIGERCNPKRFDRVCVWDIRQRQAFRGKTHPGPARIIQRAQIGADTIIMRYAGVGLEGPISSRWRVGYIDDVRPMLPYDAGNDV